ncbi:unnamed protein product [Rhodiola kirilowii]
MSYSSSSSSRCAACKCLRRKCVMGCILAPYFPSTNPQRFASVHKVFGAANITKMLEQVPIHLRGQAADSMIFEAETRMKDPVYGSAGIISQLQQQIAHVQGEIMKIKGEIARHNAQQQQQQQEQHQAQALRHKQLTAMTYFGPIIGLGLKDVNRLTNSEEVTSNSGQPYGFDEADDYLYDTFNH